MENQPVKLELEDQVEIIQVTIAFCQNCAETWDKGGGGPGDYDRTPRRRSGDPKNRVK
jgi:hypothetical protein